MLMFKPGGKAIVKNKELIYGASGSFKEGE